MGSFSYVCDECEGDECGHAGQHEYQPADVVIEVPLSDDKTIYLNAHYEGYGYAVVKLNEKTTYEFYIEQFRGYFKNWLIDRNEEYRSKKYVCNKIYTVSQEEDPCINNENARPGQTILVDYCCDDGKNKKAVEFTEEILSKCIRADAGMNLPNYLDYLISRTEKYTTEVKEISKKIEELKEKLSNAEETDKQSITDEIHEEEHQLNWRNYVIESNQENIKKEQERLSKVNSTVKKIIRRKKKTTPETSNV